MEWKEGVDISEVGELESGKELIQRETMTIERLIRVKILF